MEQDKIKYKKKNYYIFKEGIIGVLTSNETIKRGIIEAIKKGIIVPEDSSDETVK